MTNPAESLRLKLPPQDLEVLSFCAPQPKKVREWVDSLPKMNVGECSKRMYVAIQELNRLKTDAVTRFQLMEVVRDQIHFICRSLEKHFLNKSVVLPPKEARIAGLAQALQNHLAIGYKAVTVQLLARPKGLDKDAKKLFLQALHRAVSEQNRVLLRSFQLYYPAPPNFWREMHMMYFTAVRHGIAEELFSDPEEDGWESSVKDLYLRALLLATAKPNQLRQQQIEAVYQAAKHWAQFAVVTEKEPVSGLFAIDLMRDFPPVYQSLMRRVSLPQNIRYFDASAISNHLRELLILPKGEPHPEPRFHVPEKLPNELSRILVQAWGVLSERAFTRIEEQGALQLSIGLSATHYFVSGRADFNRMMTGRESALDSDQDNPFLHRGPTGRRHEQFENDDVWGLNVDAKRVDANDTLSIDKDIHSYKEHTKKTDEKDRYPQYSCEIVNTSPGGFCLSWSQDVPQLVKTGEIIGVMESDKSHWSVGVIRWVKQFKDIGVRMGIELIAPKAEACGAQAIQKKGDVTEYMRTLILPELRAIGQPATLITPNIAFQIGHKINLNERGTVSKAQLLKQVTSTASFSQFQFKVLVSGHRQPEIESDTQEADNKPSTDDDFDSVWSTL